MKGKLLIFGGSGFVGSNLVFRNNQKFDIIIADRAKPLFNVDYEEIELLRPEMIEKLLLKHRPAAVINVAAIADIDLVEKNKSLSYNINVTAAVTISKACQELGAKYLFFSSDAVFDGNNSNYTENSKTDPINYYGKTKEIAEAQIVQTNHNAIIARLSLILGFGITKGNSFLYSLDDKLKRNEQIKCPKNEIRTPVDIITLCSCVYELLESDYKGILHIGATNSIDRFNLSKLAAKALGYDDALIVPKDLDNDTDRAPRHKNGIIDVNKAKNILKTPLHTSEESIIRACLTKKDFN